MEERTNAYVWMLEQKDYPETKNAHAKYAKDIYLHALEKGTIPKEALKIYRKRALKARVKKLLHR